MTGKPYGDPPELRIVRRKCRWCAYTFRVPSEYPKRTGCPDCQPQLFASAPTIVEKQDGIAGDRSR